MHPSSSSDLLHAHSMGAALGTIQTREPDLSSVTCTPYGLVLARVCVGRGSTHCYPTWSASSPLPQSRCRAALIARCLGATPTCHPSPLGAPTDCCPALQLGHVENVENT